MHSSPLFLWIIVLAGVPWCGASAQDTVSTRRPEWFVAVSGGTRPAFAASSEQAVGAARLVLLLAGITDKPFVYGVREDACWQLGYRRRLASGWMLSVAGIYGAVRYQTGNVPYQTVSGIGDRTKTSTRNHVVSALAQAHYPWFKRRRWQFYSGAGLGVNYQQATTTEANGNLPTRTTRRVQPAYQVDLFGIRFAVFKRLGLYTEFGYGYKGQSFGLSYQP